eukprot:9352891-Lingulodinium_polyedra.AAC.1
MAPPPPGCSRGAHRLQGTESRSTQLLARSSAPADALGPRLALGCARPSAAAPAPAAGTAGLS